MDEEPLLNIEDFEPEDQLIRKIEEAYSFNHEISWDRLDYVFDKLKQWLIKKSHWEDLDSVIDHYNSFFKDDKSPMSKINFFAYMRGSLDHWYEDREWLSKSEYKAFMLSLC